MSRSRRILWPLTITYALGVLVATHLPPSRVPQTPVSDTVEHFAAYLILSALLCGTMGRGGAVRAAAASLVFAATDELTQPFVGRQCDLNDWLADAAGTVSAALAAVAIQRIRG
ncbi:MAG: VanZ family protein [Tepidisphaeraceae bacterium]